MSKTKYYKFRGKVSFAKLYPDQYDDYLGNQSWKLNLYPDENTILKIKAAGIQNKLKDDDGEKSGVTGKFFTFKRPLEKEFVSGLKKFTPPEILDKDNKKLVYYNQADDDTYEMIGDKIILGNGSEIEVTLEVYNTHRFGKGSKIMSVKILDLIEYIPPEDMSENEVDEDSDDSEESGEIESKEPIKVEKKASKKVAW